MKSFTLARAFLRNAVVSVLASGALTASIAQEIVPTTGIVFPALGKVAPRHARDITSSWWSIGGETLDRDFAIYANYKKYLGALGAKSLRVQAGWAKCEKTKGVYDFAWLDAVVDDARAQGVQPWLEFSYGNTIYAGGGDTGLGGGFPSSAEALTAWDNWCRALVARYQDRVHEWEIWNEPDINKSNTATADAYVDLYIRTAKIVRGLQPRARLWALGLAGNADYADKFLAGMKAKGQLALIDAITFHGYPRNPDDTGLVDRLRSINARHGANVVVRQGESGAPSRFQENFALSKMPWTETSQAKWDLRRLLAHRAKDVPMNLFTISDMHYTSTTMPGGTTPALRMNYKGMLATNPDQTIAYAKPIYYAAQTVFTIFDDALKRLADFPHSTPAERRLAVTGFRRDGGGLVAAFWYSDAPPVEPVGATPIDLTLPAAKFAQPVLIDVRTSTVYTIPRESWTQGEGGAVFRGLPAYDSPMLIADQGAIKIEPLAR